MKKVLKVFFIIIVVFVVIIGGFLLFLSLGAEGTAKMSVSGVDLSRVADGQYTGSYEGGRWSNSVVVTVESHKITDISIEKNVLFPMGAVQQTVIDRVIKQQTTAVDVVATATATSNAYLKAIENALAQK